MTVLMPDNPLPSLLVEEVLLSVSSLPPLEMGILSELYFFIREREEYFFKQTIIELLQLPDAYKIWNILDFVWLNDFDRIWAKPLMIGVIQKKLYFDEEFNV